MFYKHDHFDLLGKTVLEKVVFQPPVTSDARMQDEACFFHVVKGSSNLYTRNHKFSFSTSKSFVMKCGSYLNKWLKNEDGSANEVVAVHLYPDVLKLVYDGEMPEFLSAHKKGHTLPVAAVEKDKMISTYVESLLFYFENPSLVTEELIKLKVKEIILLLANAERSEQLMSLMSDLFNEDRFEFKGIIKAHLFEDLKLGELASLTGMSLSTFKRRFKSVYGKSPTRYIILKRLEKAQELLENTDQRISDIAFDCGFNDLGYFSKTFAGTYNCAPTEYRKKWLAQISK
ncbi:MAG: AraC family transcriptional regulator [Bacteroidota bacterium]